jgi:hypothetical protein
MAATTLFEPTDAAPVIVEAAVACVGERVLNRARVVDAIMTVNKTVAREYLERFEDASLRTYLLHLETASRPRGQRSVKGWVRPAETPALTAHEAPE